MNTVWQDLRYGARMLLKSPNYTLIAVAMLALGIGANTAIFSVVSAVMLRSLPYREPDRLVMVWGADQKGRLSTTAPARFLDWRVRNDVFTDMAAIEDAEISNRPRFFMTGGDRPERVRGAMVSTNFFSVLGVEPRIGRSFLPEEEQAGRNQVVIISDALWRRRFGADPEIHRKTINLNDATYTVIGVMPPDFKWNYPQSTTDTISRILARIKTIPGVELAASSNAIPLIGNGWTWRFEIPGHPSSQADGQWNANVRSVSPDFFQALGIRLVKGRLFTDHDNGAAPRVAIITGSMAAMSFPNEEPTGKYLKLDEKENSVIIGVVKDARYSHPNKPVGPAIYQPILQAASLENNLIVRTAGDPLSFSTPVKHFAPLALGS